jgi:hypothetical protein
VRQSLANYGPRRAARESVWARSAVLKIVPRRFLLNFWRLLGQVSDAGYGKFMADASQ